MFYRVASRNMHGLADLASKKHVLQPCNFSKLVPVTKQRNLTTRSSVADYLNSNTLDRRVDPAMHATSPTGLVTTVACNMAAREFCDFSQRVAKHLADPASNKHAL